ncbi:MAG: tRNA (guanosine(37)-N1)-methyltransferase TrmD [Candidatus Yanofskybacteria bacterium RIFCSPLOWO2_01_FULL_41_34]|uniref:tRNA (guanine-N(1)-)-methyltransferase n=1 Tax=Candidatus Yanofskybacteria bacterium RIFCSPHIGHO2_01_FULL_41_26 TaxID=1802661 RepID=A0A1F8EE65_9BACT|nr:MAG: tRNA (guanosine(37)-N1)-methyltransferase TrmD [Candidatus Yanofskybacteria bacterium RIFCSPHIGHO2_01_FULL_41_26]OGN21226.1 MAG: tRNA (guanosine(37)-N1)-methyltransferase TrmD [Candidatus Yanofskybacteria bacterium RIFCSPLOWO2_01_FULL_41_34]
MKFDIITIFPDLFKGFVSESLLARAQKKKLIKINLHNLRKWTDDNHKTVDGRPYGGGAGMVLKIEPIWKAVQFLKRKAKSVKRKTRTILLSAKGETFTQNDVRRLAKYDQIIFICGRYEGVDERVAKHVADEEISIGNYVLFGGEVPTMVIIETILRLIPGVVAKEESIKNESFSVSVNSKLKTVNSYREHPHYTRPKVFMLGGKKLKVPPVLLSGNHKSIEEWRTKKSR